MAIILQMIFSDAFLSEWKDFYLIKISLKFIPKGLIANNQALVKTMAWHRIGNKSLSKAMLTGFTEANMRQEGGGRDNV